MGSDKLYADRVAYLEDRAQTDPEQRARSLDGFIPECRALLRSGLDPD
jgi:hypothetical protein